MKSNSRSSLVVVLVVVLIAAAAAAVVVVVVVVTTESKNRERERFAMMACCTAWWLCVTILSLAVLAQQSQDSYQRCYDLTTTRHCFKTEQNPDNSLQNFEGATHWCAEQGYSLVTIESAEVHAAVELFLEEFELTFSNVWIAAMRHKQWTWINDDVFSDGRLSFLYATMLRLYPNNKRIKVFPMTQACGSISAVRYVIQ